MGPASGQTNQIFSEMNLPVPFAAKSSSINESPSSSVESGSYSKTLKILANWNHISDTMDSENRAH